MRARAPNLFLLAFTVLMIWFQTAPAIWMPSDDVVRFNNTGVDRGENSIYIPTLNSSPMIDFSRANNPAAISAMTKHGLRMSENAYGNCVTGLYAIRCSTAESFALINDYAHHAITNLTFTKMAMISQDTSIRREFSRAYEIFAVIPRRVFTAGRLASVAAPKSPRNFGQIHMGANSRSPHLRI